MKAFVACDVYDVYCLGQTRRLVPFFGSLIMSINILNDL